MLLAVMARPYFCVVRVYRRIFSAFGHLGRGQLEYGPVLLNDPRPGQLTVVGFRRHP